MGEARPRGTCANCGRTIERLDEEMWIHVESRKVSCQLYATPITG